MATATAAGEVVVVPRPERDRRRAFCACSRKTPLQPPADRASPCSGSYRRSACSSRRCMSANDFASIGWWKVISQPEPRDLGQLLRPRPPHDASRVAVDDDADRDGRHDPADHDRLAGRLRLRVARIPRTRLGLHRRHRHARRATADGADPDLLALQPPAPVRHRVRADPLPYGVRPAIRDLPPAQLLHRDTQGHPRVGAHRRRVGDQDLRAPDPAAGSARPSHRSRSSSSSGPGTTCWWR